MLNETVRPELDTLLLNEMLSKADKKARKDAERDGRPLDPWDRYRALSDLVDHLLDLIELADRKTRFALMIVGALNAANVVVAARIDTLITRPFSPWVWQLYIISYVVLSLYFFAFAIIALRPRHRTMNSGRLAGGKRPRLRLRLITDILAQDFDSYHESWRTATTPDVTREMALQAYLMAITNDAKYRALNRVYLGLCVLVALTATAAATIALRIAAA
jgi:hypothetical protein